MGRGGETFGIRRLNAEVTQADIDQTCEYDILKVDELIFL